MATPPVRQKSVASEVNAPIANSLQKTHADTARESGARIRNFISFRKPARFEKYAPSRQNACALNAFRISLLEISAS
jgi:hypothetical protein